MAEGLAVTALPGPSAPLMALLLSALPSDRFFFGGFLPAKSGPRREALQALDGLDASLIYFEAPQRLAASLAAMARSEEHTSELQSLMRISYAVFCLKKKKNHQIQDINTQP